MSESHERSHSLVKNVLYLVTTLAITAVLVRIFLLDSFTVVGNSMAPTIIEGDYVFVNKLAYRFNEPQRNDIVVGNFREMEDIKAIKRVLGLPQEWIHIEGGSIFKAQERGGEQTMIRQLNSNSYTGEESEEYSYRLDPHEYFLIGDNGITSIDSRELGPVDRYHIDGRVIGSFRLKELRFKWFE